MVNQTRLQIRAVFLLGMLCLILCCCGKEDTLTLVPAKEMAQDGSEKAANEMSGQVGMPGEMADSSAVKAEIYVYVCGAVVTPGVVALPEGSRAEAALSAAGGFAENAQTDYVNLAALVQDGEKLYFPTREEAESLERADKAAVNGLVNINTASVEELCTLPGIGESRAADIVSYREKNGAFQKPEDLMKVSGIKTNAYEKLKDKIIVK